MRIVRTSILGLLLVVGALLAVGSPGSAEGEAEKENLSGAGLPGAEDSPESASAGSPQAKEGPEAEGGEPPLETFIPTERLPADSAISFPVDI